MNTRKIQPCLLQILIFQQNVPINAQIYAHFQAQMTSSTFDPIELLVPSHENRLICTNSLVICPGTSHSCISKFGTEHDYLQNCTNTTPEMQF